MLMKKIKLIIIMFLFIPSVFSYTETETIINDNYNYVYDITKSELPLYINKTLFTIPFEPYIINISYFNETSNKTEYNVTYINNFSLDVMTGQFINAEDIIIENDTNYFINITIPEDTSVGTYNSFIELFYDEGIYNKTFFKFDITYNDIFQNVSYELQTDKNYFYYLWYDGQLPRTRTVTHTIKTNPNEYMTINCTGLLECSKNYTATSNYTTFTATISLEDGALLKTYKSYIFINTSYNMSGNITYEVELQHTPIELIEREVPVFQDPTNLTPEQLAQYAKEQQTLWNEALEKLQAANKSKEIEKLVDKPIPYMANKEEILKELRNEFEKKDAQNFNKLTEIANNVASDNDKLRTENIELQTRMTDLFDNLRIIKLNSSLALDLQNKTMHEENVVIRKPHLIITSIFLFIIISGFVTFTIISNKSWGGLSK